MQHRRDGQVVSSSRRGPHVPLALNLDMASAPGAAFIRPRLALLAAAEPMRPNCKLDADPMAGGGVSDPEARPNGLCDARVTIERETGAKQNGDD